MPKKKQMDISAEADMTPMIDMTFQLIAFFMILINFADDNQVEEIKLPSSELAKPPDGPVDLPISLQLTKQGTVLYNGDYIAIPNMHKPLVTERQILVRNGKSPSMANVIIRADGDTQTGKVQELIKVCQDEKFEKFALRAKQEEAQSFGKQ